MGPPSIAPRSPRLVLLSLAETGDETYDGDRAKGISSPQDPRANQGHVTKTQKSLSPLVDRPTFLPSTTTSDNFRGAPRNGGYVTLVRFSRWVVI